jgi:biopolymer transport protein ExbD
MAKGKRGTPEINAASMADIAFLLLIFFLLVTTIDTDKGLVRLLPPMPEEDIELPIFHDRNIFIVLVNSADQLLVEGEHTQVSQLKEKTKEFIMNPYKKANLSDGPQEAIVSLKSDRGTSYNMYIQVQNELAAAYNELREEMSRNSFGLAYRELTKEQQRDIRQEIPMKISEAEPENIGGAKL